MKLLISGANGQVGWELSRQAKYYDFECVSFNRNEMDITNHTELIEKLRTEKPNIFINAAAYTAVDNAEQEKDMALEVNSNAVHNIAQLCQEQSIFLIHISTDYVFSGSQIKPYIESDGTNPLNVYGKTKLEGEDHIRSTINNHIILRTSWVFGIHGKNFLKTIIRLAHEGQNIRVVNDQFGSPTSARSIAETILSICEQYRVDRKLQFGTYHYSGIPISTWYSFAKKVLDVAFDSQYLESIPRIEAVTSDQYITLSKKPINSSLSCNKIEKVFKIKRSDWEKDIHLVINSLKDNIQ